DAAAISPDGKYLVYVADDDRSLWLKTPGSENAQPIIKAGSIAFNEPSFSQDASVIYYTTSKNGMYSLYQVTVAGGASTKVADVGDGPEYAFSPDGKRLAFTKSDPEGKVVLIISNRDGSDQKTLASHDSSNWCTRPKWSPDGNTIACPAEIED